MIELQLAAQYHCMIQQLILTQASRNIKLYVCQYRSARQVPVDAYHLVRIHILTKRPQIPIFKLNGSVLTVYESMFRCFLKQADISTVKWLSRPVSYIFYMTCIAISLFYDVHQDWSMISLQSLSLLCRVITHFFSGSSKQQ